MQKIILLGSSFIEFTIIILFLSCVVIVAFAKAFGWHRKIISLFRTERKDNIPLNISHQLNKAVKINNPAYIYVFIGTLSLIALGMMFRQGFVSLEYNDRDIILHYNCRMKPVILKWGEVKNILLQKREDGRNRRILINTVEGRTYRSYVSFSQKDADKIREDYNTIKEAETQYKFISNDKRRNREQ